jgi:CheY-like chemotaxis protein
LRILLAEDNAVNQMVASERLKRAGHAMVVVENGVQALARLKTEKFDLALIDVHMPEMDGFATIQALRAFESQGGTHLPVIALTANAMKGDRERCIQGGFDEYVSKPIRFDQLFATIDLLVGKTPAQEVPAPSATPVVDRSELLARFDNSEEMVRIIVEIFLKSCPGWFKDLRAALAGGDAKKLHQVSHSIKGAVGNFTEGTAFSLAQSIEKSAKEGKISGLQADCEALQVEMERLQEALKVWAKEWTPMARD